MTQTPNETLTSSQKVALEDLLLNKVSSAIEGYRHAYEALVKKGIAIKHTNGRSVTYTLASN